MAEVADTPNSIVAQIAAWKARRASQFDPVRFRYLEALAARSAKLEGEARALLDTRLVQAFSAYQSAFEQAREDAQKRVKQIETRFPAASAFVRQRFNACDFHSVNQLADRLERTAARITLKPLLKRFDRQGRDSYADEGTVTLDEMLRQQELAALQSGPDLTGGITLEREHADELRALRQFRDVWAKRIIEKAVAQAMEDAPENAGPLNSHRLVIGAITQMRDISPDYLNRFVSYIDTLLWLEQAAKHFPAVEPKTPDIKRANTASTKSTGKTRR